MKIQTKLGRTRTDTDQRILIYIYTIVICTLNAYRCWTKTIAVIMSDKAMLVLGEAPESDDEDQNDRYDGNYGFVNPKNETVDHDQTESDKDSNNHTHNTSKIGRSRSAKDNFNGRAENYKMSEDTLLHRKLKEKNMQFYSNLSTFNKQMYINAANQMNETNQQLVKAQVLLQDSVTNWKYIEQNLSHIKRKMVDILSEEYIPKINI